MVVGWDLTINLIKFMQRPNKKTAVAAATGAEYATAIQGWPAKNQHIIIYKVIAKLQLLWYRDNDN